MALEHHTKNPCRYCGMSLIYRRRFVQETGEEVDYGRREWFHEDGRDDYNPESSYGRWGEGRRPCMPGLSDEDGFVLGLPRNICMEDKQDGGVCGRKIPRDNLDEDIFACGTHAKFERSRRAAQEATNLRKIKDAEEGDLRQWARKALSGKVATILEAGLPVKWVSGDPGEDRYRREHDPEMHVTVLIEDLLDYVEKHRD